METRRDLASARSRRSPWLLGFLVLVATCPCVCAPTTNLAPETDLVERIAHEEQDRERRVVGLGRVRLSSLQRVSGAIGGMVARLPKSYDCSSVCEYRGWRAEVEPGLYGGQLSGGYAVVFGEKDDNSPFLSDIFLAYGIRASLLRAWGSTELSPRAQTMAGIEGEFTIIRVNFTLGLFRALDSGDVEDRWTLAGGLGWGF